MAKKLQLRRGTTSQHSSFTGAVGEVTVDTDKKTAVVHDGSTAGGVPLATATDIATKAALAGATFTGPITVGVDDTGHDVKFFGATAGKYCLWDESQNTLIVNPYLEVEDQATFKGQINLSQASGDQNIVGGPVVFGKTVGNVGFQPHLKLDYGVCEAYWQGAKKFETTTSGVTVTGTVDLTGSIIFEGATANAYETTLAVTDPTADQVITLPNATGTVPLTQIQQTWAGPQAGTITALTDGATIAIDFNSSNNFSVTLAGNRTLGQPSNQVPGQSGSIFVTQDGTGGRTLNYHADWKFPGGTAPTVDATDNAVSRIDYIVAAANQVHAVASLDVK